MGLPAGKETAVCAVSPQIYDMLQNEHPVCEVSPQIHDILQKEHPCL